MQRTRCPHCNKKLKYAEGLEGGTYKCPKCGKGVTLHDPRDVGAEMKKTGASITRVLRVLAIGLVFVGAGFLVYHLVQGRVKEHHRETHRIQLR